jgi:hypothetical protein
MSRSRRTTVGMAVAALTALPMFALAGGSAHASPSAAKMTFTGDGLATATVEIGGVTKPPTRVTLPFTVEATGQAKVLVSSTDSSPRAWLACITSQGVRKRVTSSDPSVECTLGSPAQGRRVQGSSSSGDTSSTGGSAQIVAQQFNPTTSATLATTTTNYSTSGSTTSISAVTTNADGGVTSRSTTTEPAVTTIYGDGTAPLAATGAATLANPNGDNPAPAGSSTPDTNGGKPTPSGGLTLTVTAWDSPSKTFSDYYYISDLTWCWGGGVPHVHWGSVFNCELGESNHICPGSCPTNDGYFTNLGPDMRHPGQAAVHNYYYNWRGMPGGTNTAIETYHEGSVDADYPGVTLYTEYPNIQMWGHANGTYSYQADGY